MKPINFKQSTKVLQKPGTLSDSECGTLPVWCDGKQCVSCWKPSFKERINILFGGKVWLGVMSAFYVGLAWGALIGFIAGCIAGAIKEWWDSKGHGTVELMDFAFTAMGAASGACVSVPVMMLLRLIIQL